MPRVFDVAAQTLLAAIRLDDGRALALDTALPGRHGWALFEHAVFRTGDWPQRVEDVSVAEAFELAPGLGHYIVAATLHAVAWQEERGRDMRSPAGKQVATSMRDMASGLGEELPALGVPREAVNAARPSFPPDAVLRVLVGPDLKSSAREGV